jgi:hypothetical protein
VLPASIGVIAANTALSVYPWCLLVITGFMLVSYVLSIRHKQLVNVKEA